MKLCRYGERGHERPGMIAGDGTLRDLSSVLRDIDADAISPEGLSRLAGIDDSTLPVVRGSPRLGVPVSGVSKFLAIGLNYRDHAAETGMKLPTEPIVFSKAVSCLSGPNDRILKPRLSVKLDWEVELGFVVGKRARNVSVESALDYIAGYCAVNDVSERSWQTATTQWDKGKGHDSFGPVGPWLVTKDELPDPQNLKLWLDVNGQRMQTGNTATMVFSCAELLSHISGYMTLLPGDIVTTGTPPGVGMARKPEPVWLHPGDRVCLGVEGLGEQDCVVIDEPD